MVTGLLVTAQIAVWLVVTFQHRDNSWTELAMRPGEFDVRRMIGSAFVHVHPIHLGLNIALLWLFGSALERAIGPIRFFVVYLGAGLFAGLMFWAVTVATQVDLLAAAISVSPQGAVGASGAIAGVMGAYCVRLSHRSLRLPGFSLPPAPLLAVWLIWEFASAVLGTLNGTTAGASHWAHFAGFTFGLAVGQMLRLDRAARREDLLQTASEASIEDDHPRAAAALSALLESDPREHEVRRLLIQARLAMRDRVGAEAIAREGLVLAVRERDCAAAIREYRECLKLLTWIRLPDGVRYRIGCWLADLEDHVAAYTALVEAAREDAATPGAAAALFRAGEIAAENLEDPRRARMAWQRILLDYGDSAWRDRAYERLGQLSGRSPTVSSGQLAGEKQA